MSELKELMRRHNFGRAVVENVPGRIVSIEDLIHALEVAS